MVGTFPRSPAKPEQDVELYKIGLEFFLATLLGGGVSLLYKGYQRELQAAENHRAFLRRYLRALGRVYGETKKSRRLLRARGLRTRSDDPNERWIDSLTYATHMERILDQQLGLERLVQLSTAYDDPQLSAAAGDAKRMEEYLRSLLSEYESGNHPTILEGGGLSLGTLPELCKFVGPYAESGRFREDFVHAFFRASEKISKAIVG
jgi:hypothetical protein